MNTGRTRREIALPHPYPRIDVVTNADPATTSISYQVAGPDLTAAVTVTPETGDGTTAVPTGVTVTCTRDGHTLTVELVDVPTRGPTPPITADQLHPTGANGASSADYLAAVLSALVADWANRDDAARLRRIAATRTAESRLADATRILTALRARLTDVLTDLENQSIVTEELRGLAATQHPRIHPPSPDLRPPAPDPTPAERSLRAARAVTAHTRHLDPDITTADIYSPANGGDAITAFLTDLLHLLDDLGLDPAEITQRASDTYDTQHTDTHP